MVRLTIEANCKSSGLAGGKGAVLDLQSYSLVQVLASLVAEDHASTVMRRTALFEDFEGVVWPNRVTQFRSRSRNQHAVKRPGFAEGLVSRSSPLR